MNSVSPTCQNCKNQFIIEPDDFSFYEKMGVPAPNLCPECRFKRRALFRNETTPPTPRIVQRLCTARNATNEKLYNETCRSPEQSRRASVVGRLKVWYDSYMAKAVRQFTAVYRKSGKWYSGWIEEIPGVNTQGKTLAETKENLRDALLLILEANRLVHAKEISRGKTFRESVTVSL